MNDYAVYVNGSSKTCSNTQETMVKLGIQIGVCVVIAGTDDEDRLDDDIPESGCWDVT